MPNTKMTDEGLNQCRNLWLQVCRSRGTPAPDQAQVTRFLASLAQPERAELEQALLLCLNGREKRRELALVSWAAACTRPDFVAKVQAHGLSCTGYTLFGAGLGLMASGWDMSARIAQLAGNPQDVAVLASLLGMPLPPPVPPAPLSPPAAPLPFASPLAAPSPAVPSVLQVATLAPAAPVLQPVQSTAPDSAPIAAAAFTPPEQALRPAPPVPKPGAQMPQVLQVPQAPQMPQIAQVLQMPLPPPAPEPAQAAKPGRAKRQGLAPVPHILAEEVAPDAFLQSPENPELAPFAPSGWLQVRLFGRESAHTLEIGPHRRGASFMGVHVVTIESARALPDASGYDWANKLTLQLTPEEMPLAAAVLMNLSASARFTQHGAERDKFVELRRQEGGVVLVTGQGGAIHAVPVKTGVLYYLLSLFCRAMARGLPGSSVAEVLALIKAAHG
jgi:hypothetical protein